MKIKPIKKGSTIKNMTCIDCGELYSKAKGHNCDSKIKNRCSVEDEE